MKVEPPFRAFFLTIVCELHLGASTSFPVQPPRKFGTFDELFTFCAVVLLCFLHLGHFVGCSFRNCDITEGDHHICDMCRENPPCTKKRLFGKEMIDAYESLELQRKQKLPVSPIDS
jgi:hypothetical protein